MQTQLNLFQIENRPVAKKPVTQNENVLLNAKEFSMLFKFANELDSLYMALKKNREYVVFTKSVLKASGNIGKDRFALIANTRKRNFRAKLELAKNELKEIKRWLDLLEKGCLLKGDYSMYMAQVTSLLADVRELIPLVKK